MSEDLEGKGVVLERRQGRPAFQIECYRVSLDRLCERGRRPPFHFVVLDYELLLQHLDSVQVVRQLLLGKHDFTEITLTEHGQEVEVVQANLALSNSLRRAYRRLGGGLCLYLCLCLWRSSLWRGLSLYRGDSRWCGSLDRWRLPVSIFTA